MAGGARPGKGTPNKETAGDFGLLSVLWRSPGPGQRGFPDPCSSRASWTYGRGRSRPYRRWRRRVGVGRRGGPSGRKEPQTEAPRQKKLCEFEEQRGGQWSFTLGGKGTGKGQGQITQVLWVALEESRFILCAVESH